MPTTNEDALTGQSAGNPICLEKNWPDLAGLTCYFAEGYRLQFHARDLVHLVWSNDLDLPRRPFENESPGGADPNMLASSYVD
jgi:hypothetical protein